METRGILGIKSTEHISESQMGLIFVFSLSCAVSDRGFPTVVWGKKAGAGKESIKLIA